jgi:hypothetical protein
MIRQEGGFEDPPRGPEPADDAPADGLEALAGYGPGCALAALGKRAEGRELLLTVALFEGAMLMQAGGLLFAAVFTLVAASGFFGYGVADAWHERRELRRRSGTGQGGQDQGDGYGGRALEGRPPGGSSRGRSDMRADGHGAELRAPRAGRDPRHSPGWLIPILPGAGPA